MKNLRFGARLLLGFSTLGVLMGALGVFALRESSILADLTQKLYDHPMAVSNAALDIRAGVLEIENGLFRLKGNESESEIDRIDRETARTDAMIAARFDLIRERFLGDPRQIEAARALYRAWHDGRGTLVTALRNAAGANALAAARAQQKLRLDRLAEAMDGVVAFARNKSDEFMARADATRRRSFWSILLLMFATLGIAATIAVIITRSITRPMAALRGAMATLAAGRHDVEIPGSERRDEIGGLIADIQRASGEALRTMGHMDEVMARVSETTATIVAAVEQQDSATKEIAHNVQGAAAGTRRVSDEISTVAGAAAETGGVAQQMKAAADALTRLARDLKAQVDGFIRGVRTA
ncbi:MAG: HAMP domain-containing protein [Rhodothalassiaceae bacterium]